jgi:DNA-binding transcriptional LysR family regulator
VFHRCDNVADRASCASFRLDDLNDLVLFAAVVAHGSFSRAASTLGVTKSRVSRGVASLEARLGVRLLQRSTRALKVTDVGAAFYAHCETMTQAARAAFDVAERAGERPAGRLRVSCPVGVAHIFLAPVLPRFLRAHPDIRLELDLTNRRVDVIGEGYDIALRVRSTLEDSNLVMRSFGVSDQLLAASPSFLAEHGPFGSIESLHDAIGVGPDGVAGERAKWTLTGADGAPIDVEYRPALVTNDVFLLTQSVLAGVGIGQLPFNLCGDAIANGRLIQLLPEYRIAGHRLHAVFPSRRGLVPAVRVFLDFLDTELSAMTARANRSFVELHRRRHAGA